MSTKRRIRVVRTALASGEEVFMAYCPESEARGAPHHEGPLRHIVLAPTRKEALEGMRTYLRNLERSAAEDAPTNEA